MLHYSIKATIYKYTIATGIHAVNVEQGDPEPLPIHVEINDACPDETTIIVGRAALTVADLRRLAVARVARSWVVSRLEEIAETNGGCLTFSEDGRYSEALRKAVRLLAAIPDLEPAAPQTSEGYAVDTGTVGPEPWSR